MSSTFKEIEPDTSKLLQDLREIQKTVQYFGDIQIQNTSHNLLIQKDVEKIVKTQVDILDKLHDIQNKIKNLESQPSSSRRKQGGWLPPSFGTEPLLHQKGKAVEVKRELTEDEKMRALLRGEFLK